MKKGYFLNTLKQNIFIETDKRRNDTTAAAVIDILADVYNMTPEKVTECKKDRATLDDLKRRLTPCTLYENGQRLQFFKGSEMIIDYHKTSPEIITRIL